MIIPHASRPVVRDHVFRRAAVSSTLVAFLLTCGGCGTMPPSDDTPPNGDGDTPADTVADCLGCHTNETLLKAVAREEPPPAEDTGEG